MALVFDKNALSFVDLPNGGWIGKGVSAATMTAWVKSAEGGVGAIEWLSQDIGTATTGTASISNGVFTIEGSGTDIWNASDGFRYVYFAVTGDCTVTARIVSVENTHAHAKAGVLFRESLAANSIFFNVAGKPVASSTLNVDHRLTTGATATNQATGFTNPLPTNPLWVRVSRSGNSFSAWLSLNGTDWTAVGTPTSITMATTYYVGIGVTSHLDGTLCTAVVDNVNVSSAPAGTERYVIQISHNLSMSQSRMSLSQSAAGYWRASGRRIDGEAAVIADSLETLEAGRIYFLAAVFDFTGGSLSLYVDGVLHTTTPVASWTGPSSDTFPAAASIGSNGDASAGFFHGTVDDICVYHEALDAAAVRGLYVAKGRHRRVGFVRWTLREGGSGTQAKAKIWDKWIANSHGATGTYLDAWPVYAPENLVSSRAREG